MVGFLATCEQYATVLAVGLGPLFVMATWLDFDLLCFRLARVAAQPCLKSTAALLPFLAQHNLVLILQWLEDLIVSMTPGHSQPE